MEIDKVIDKLKQAEALAHYWHLRTASFARHMALGAFYEDITDMIDGLAESCMGKYGTRISIPASINLNEPEDHVAYFTALGEYVDLYMNTIFVKEAEIQDHLANIRNLINATLYKFTLS